MIFPAINNWVRFLGTDPNSPEGLRMRARSLEEKAGKPENAQYAENFMLYKRFNKRFGDKSVIGIIGDNQSAKTTVIEMMEYCLQGSSRAEKEIELIHKG